MSQWHARTSASGRHLMQAAPSSVFATGCAPIDSILRDHLPPPSKDTSYTGPFTQYPAATPPNGPGCLWQVVTTGEEMSRIVSEPTPRVKFLEAVTASGNFPTPADPPLRIPPEGLTPARGTIAFLKGNGLRMDMTKISDAEQPFPADYNNTALRSVRVMWDWHIAIPDAAPLRPASLAFTFKVNYTMETCQVRRHVLLLAHAQDWHCQ
jgi:hypothetical protein